MSVNGAERPIFLDPSGRRARVVRVLGRAAAGLGAAWGAAILFAVGPGSALPGLSVSQGTSAKAPPAVVAERPVASRTRALHWSHLSATRAAGRRTLVAASVSG
jgi:hypothetical protein